MLVYANDAPGFTAVLKQRYSDFIVNEVTKEGKVVRLTKLSVDKKESEGKEKEQEEEGKKKMKNEEGSAVAVGVEAGAGAGEPDTAAAAAAATVPAAATEAPTKEEDKEEDDVPTKAAKAIAELGEAAQWPEDVRKRLVVELTALLEGEGEGGKEEEVVVVEKEEEKKEGEQRFRKRKSAWRGTPRQVVFPPTDDKVLRRGQHEYFKRHFRGVVEGDTVDPTPTSTPAEKGEGGKEGGPRVAGGMKSVRIVKVGEGKRTGCWKGYMGATPTSSSTSSYGPQKRGRDGGGREGGQGSSYGREEYRPKYLHFVLYKENHTTTSAIAALAKALRVKENRFSFAGMKDKRGLTTQQVRDLDPSSLPPSLPLFFPLIYRMLTLLPSLPSLPPSLPGVWLPPFPRRAAARQFLFCVHPPPSWEP